MISYMIIISDFYFKLLFVSMYRVQGCMGPVTQPKTVYAITIMNGIESIIIINFIGRFSLMIQAIFQLSFTVQ